MKNTSNDLQDLKKMLKNVSVSKSGTYENIENASAKEPATAVHKKRRAGKETEVQKNSSCADILGIHVGTRIVLMDAEIHGTVTSIDGKSIRLLTDDGLLMVENIYNLAPADPEQEKAMKETVVSANATGDFSNKRNKAEGNLVVDLHIDALPGGRNVSENNRLGYQLEVFKRTMNENLKHRGRQITFIHGVGDGILKHAILKELEEVYALRCSWNPYHSGATTVTIK